MPKIEFVVPHSLGKAEAIDRVKHFLPKVQEFYKGQVSDLTQSWVGDALNFAFKTFGFNIKGNLEVSEDSVKLQQDLPFAAMMFKGKIETQIREQLERMLS